MTDQQPETTAAPEAAPPDPTLSPDPASAPTDAGMATPDVPAGFVPDPTLPQPADGPPDSGSATAAAESPGTSPEPTTDPATDPTKSETPDDAPSSSSLAASFRLAASQDLAAALRSAPAGPVKFYDSIGGPGEEPALPPDATHAMLYADRIPPQHRSAVPDSVAVRWITERGDPKCLALDYEAGTWVYQQPSEVRRFFDGRFAARQRAVLYCQRSLLSQVHSYVGSTLWTRPDFLFWIPTLDNKQWTAVELAADILSNYGVAIRPNQIWGNQYAEDPDSGGPWDVSNLLGSWD